MGDLQTILKGKILKYPVNIIAPRWQNAPIYTLCYREAAASFKGVKLAYPGAVDPEMRFVQIWVDGDVYALNDLYYLGGVKPHGSL